MKFIDYVRIIVKSGDGGAGHISFRREKFVPKGGPDGGNGGKGGDVIFRTDPHMSTLLDFKYHRNFSAKDGEPGQKSRKFGKDGKDVIIKVPCGTVVKDAQTEEIIADLHEPNKDYVFAEGGKGGKGNAEFATPTNQTPRYAQPGIPGVETEIILELKLIADVGIVGYPNVGKSTLISVISEAKPKIADYPFTTLTPNLGMVRIAEGKSFVVADIPGLIEGASEGKGLGHQFLRHVERTKVLLFIIESTSENPKADFKVLLNELLKYNPEMKHKNKLVCFSKSDLVDEETRKKLLKTKFPGIKGTPLIISAPMMENLDELKWAMWGMVELG
ncbi:GTPase ObgE [Bacteroidetes/Chlorobi group bacterium ChocPot_Mid]|nr:MAG: GTPase ObgE [Bacteroidetes/Chlorobi group bacterium ChocPot_Mid]